MAIAWVVNFVCGSWNILCLRRCRIKEWSFWQLMRSPNTGADASIITLLINLAGKLHMEIEGTNVDDGNGGVAACAVLCAAFDEVYTSLVREVGVINEISHQWTRTLEPISMGPTSYKENIRS